MGQLFGNNGYLLAESENSIMGIKLGIIVSALLRRRDDGGRGCIIKLPGAIAPRFLDLWFAPPDFI